MPEVSKAYNTLGRQFIKSEQMNSPFFRQYFTQRHQKNTTKCYCLGIGHFARIEHDSPRETKFNRALYQLVLMQVLIRGSKKEDTPFGKGLNVTVEFRDCDFTPIKRTILFFLGYHSVKDPDTSLDVTESTLIFAFHVDHTFISEALQRKAQVIYIGNDLEKVLQNVEIGERDKALFGEELRVLKLVNRLPLRRRICRNLKKTRLDSGEMRPYTGWIPPTWSLIRSPQWRKKAKGAKQRLRWIRGRVLALSKTQSSISRAL